MVEAQSTHAEAQRANSLMEQMQSQMLDMGNASRQDNQQQSEKLDEKLDQVLDLLKILSLPKEEMSFVSISSAREVNRRLDTPSSLSEAAQTILPDHTASFSYPVPAFPAFQRNRRPRNCTCPRTLSRTQASYTLGGLVLTTRDEKVGYHSPPCPLAAMKSKTRQLDMKLSLLRNIVSWRISLACSLTMGAGGYSFAPGLECIRLVDPKTNPAFCVIRLMKEAFWPCYGLTDGVDESVILHGLDVIVDLIRNGKASLLDVNASDHEHLVYSLISALLNYFQYNHKRSTALISGMHRFLVALHTSGVAPPRNDRWARLTTVDFHHFGAGISDEIPFACPLMTNVHKGPMLQALWDRDMGGLNFLVSQRPETLTEAMFYHSSEEAFHVSCLAMAISWPAGMQILVDAFHRQGLPPGHGWIVAEAVTAHFLVSPSGTSCCESFQRLGKFLTLGVPFRKLALIKNIFGYIQGSNRCHIGGFNPCVSCGRAIVLTMQTQREELKSLALRQLRPDQINQFELRQDSVLDFHAGPVVRALEKSSTPVPESLWVPGELRSIYSLVPRSETRSDKLREELWNAGFRDMTPESMLEEMGSDSASFDLIDEIYPELVLWYLSRGLDVDDSYRKHPVAHWIGALVRVQFSKKESSLTSEEKKEDDNGRELLEIMSRWDHRDSCRCYCSPSGCTALSIRLHNMNRFGTGTWWKHISLDYFDLSIFTRMVLLRMLTFTELDMAHVCCHRQNELTDPLDREEAHELQDEDADLIEILEELMTDFEHEILHECSNTSLEDFVPGYWTRKMKEVLPTMSDSEMDEIVVQAREIDVALTVCEEEEEEEEEEEPMDHPEEGTVEYWIGLMDGVKNSKHAVSETEPDKGPRAVTYESLDVDIPATFLIGPAEQPVTLSHVPFASSPVPEYEGCFAITLDDVLSKDECLQLIELAEESVIPDSDEPGPWRPAMEIVDRVFERCCQAQGLREMLAVVEQNYGGSKRETWNLSCVNKRIRFLKYIKGNLFKPHVDSPYWYQANGQTFQTNYTLHLYLNDSAEYSPDSKLVGGATSFLSRDRKRRIDMNPKAGSVLIFQHRRLLHEGATVTAGVKFTARMDILYELVEKTDAGESG
ncbi:hypothetical protein S7711_09877 [Stachybotrys chartarum IBT 7711]|uniref:Prolyl 4-hydroxylase alpha subunit domain-containing protein n=1 Tax=Stachybotrys chartarum (strain CBS 109288 / IBT 7711) TaxID=1280523 RepID=A0A084AGA3_STACB|nr:hypothetical protein S7711_09877 [Stachybotrys chartarum IBT 7711]